MKTAMLTAGAALALATSTFAQMVPPAPDKAPAPEQAIPVTPTMIPPMPELTAMPAPAKRVAREVKLPNLPYKSLVEKDKADKLVMLKEPAEYAALKRNPMLTQDEVAKLGDYLHGRRASFEVIVAENLDLVEKIEGGIFEKKDLSDRKAFVELANVAKPLKAPAAPKPVYVDLKEKGMLSDEQAAFNQKISSEYHWAVIRELNADANRNLAMAYKQFLDEPVYIHHQMLLDASKQIDTILPTLNLDAAAGGKAAGAVQKVKAAKNDDDRIAAMQELNAGLSLDQRKAVLRGVVGKGAKK